MKKTTVINIFAGPSCGKTTLAAKLFYEFKVSNLFASVELVQEHAKQLVWQKRFDELKNQKLVTQGQIKLLMPLVDEVELIITDSPLELGLVYSPMEQYQIIQKMIKSCNEQYNAINLFLERGDFKFEEKGRIHNEEESREKDLEIRTLLDTLEADYTVINHNTSCLDIAQNIIPHLFR